VFAKKVLAIVSWHEPGFMNLQLSSPTFPPSWPALEWECAGMVQELSGKAQSYRDGKQH